MSRLMQASSGSWREAGKRKDVPAVAAKDQKQVDLQWLACGVGNLESGVDSSDA
jgi:hypothetical protein